MLTLLCWLLLGHNYKIIKEHEVIGFTGTEVVGKCLLLQCKCCGSLKTMSYEP